LAHSPENLTGPTVRPPSRGILRLIGAARGCHLARVQFLVLSPSLSLSLSLSLLLARSRSRSLFLSRRIVWRLISCYFSFMSLLLSRFLSSSDHCDDIYCSNFYSRSEKDGLVIPVLRGRLGVQLIIARARIRSCAPSSAIKRDRFPVGATFAIGFSFTGYREYRPSRKRSSSFAFADPIVSSSAIWTASSDELPRLLDASA